MFKSFPARIFLIALGLRLVPLLFARNLGIGLDDMFQYDMLARSLAAGNGFRWYAPQDLARLAPYFHVDLTSTTLDPRGILTTFRAPLYPGFLSILYAFNGVNESRFFAARLAQVLLGALLAPMTYFVSKNMSFTHDSINSQERSWNSADRERVSVLASWVVAGYPMFLLFPLALASENLFFILVLASILALLRLSKVSSLVNLQANHSNARRLTLYSVLAGVLLGLSALTRSVILPFAVLAILWIWFCLQQFRLALFTTLALGCTIAPWIVRNSLLSNQFTGIETSLGYNLYVGYYPQSTGTFAFGPSLDLLSISNDKVRDQVGAQQAFVFIRQDPSRVFYLAVRRMGYFFDLELRAFTYFYVNNFLGYIPPLLLSLVLLILAMPFVIIALSAVFGVTTLQGGKETLLLALLFVGYLLPHILILSEERFHLTLVPLFAIFASAFWVRGFSIFRSRGGVFLFVPLLIAALLLLNWGFELTQDASVLRQMLSAGGNQLYLPY